MKIYVQGSNILTSLGDLSQTWSALLALKKPENHKPIPLAGISHLSGGYGSRQRFEHLLDLLLQDLPELDKDTALICSTTKGAVDELFSCQLPKSSQPWTVADEISKRLDLFASKTSVSAACASGTIAIIQGALRILGGECSRALIVGCDILSDFVINGFMSLKALSPDGCKPFDQNRNGLTLGEGAGWLLLTREQCHFNSTTSSITLSGWGTSCDARHITAPCRNGSGLIRVLDQVTMNNTRVVGGINTHGTGTSYNDAMELLAYTTFFTSPPPLCSIKGALGHCLGAAGVIEAALSMNSLVKSMLPPTVGLINPEKECYKIIHGSSSLPLIHPSVLSCNSGFGGINSGVLFEQT